MECTEPVAARWCAADGNCQGVFILECGSLTRTFGDCGSIRRWQRELSSLAMHIQLVWPFGVRLSPMEGTQGLRGCLSCFWWARPRKRSVSQARGRVPASSARSVGTGCQASSATEAAPLPPVPSTPQQPREGPSDQPYTESLGMITPIFQVRILRLRISGSPELPGPERGGTETQVFLQRDRRVE